MDTPQENPEEEYLQNDEAFPNLSEKELNRDLINLHLPETDLVGDEDRGEYLKKLYGDDIFAGLDLSDDDEEEQVDEEE